LSPSSLAQALCIPPMKARQRTWESRLGAVVVQAVSQELCTSPCGSPASAPTSFAIAGWVIVEYRVARPHSCASWFMNGATRGLPITWP